MCTQPLHRHRLQVFTAQLNYMSPAVTFLCTVCKLTKPQVSRTTWTTTTRTRDDANRQTSRNTVDPNRVGHAVRCAKVLLLLRTRSSNSCCQLRHLTTMQVHTATRALLLRKHWEARPETRPRQRRRPRRVQPHVERLFEKQTCSEPFFVPHCRTNLTRTLTRKEENADVQQRHRATSHDTCSTVPRRWQGSDTSHTSTSLPLLCEGGLRSHT